MAQTPLSGYAESLSSIWKEIGRFKWQAWVDFRKDLDATAKSTFAGATWNIIIPLIPLSIYIFVGWMGVFSPTKGIAGVAYVAIGATLWLLFSSAMMIAMTAISSKGSTAARAGYPLSALILSGFYQTLFEFGLRVLVCILIFVLVQAPDPMGGLIGLVIMLAGLLLFVGAGLIIAVFSVAAHDLRKLLPIFLQYGFFLSQVLFPLPRNPVTDILFIVNPFAVFIDGVRQMMMTGAIDNPVPLFVWSLIGVAVFLLGVRFLRNAEHHVREFL